MQEDLAPTPEHNPVPENTGHDHAKPGQLTPKQRRVIFGVGLKIIGIIASLLIISIVSLVWISTRIFNENISNMIQQTNSDTAFGVATQVRELLQNSMEKSRTIGILMHGEGVVATPTTTEAPKKIEKHPIVEDLLSKDPDFFAVYLHQWENGQPTLKSKAISPSLQALNDPEGESALNTLMSDPDFKLQTVFEGAVKVSTVNLSDGTPALALGLPFVSLNDRFTHVLTAVIKQSKFSSKVQDSDFVSSFIVDSKGQLLAHKDPSRVAARENMSSLEIVKQLISGTFNNGQTKYADPATGEVKLGAYRTVGLAGLGIVSEVPEEQALEAARLVESRARTIGIIILAFACFLGFFFSDSITSSIKVLVEASHRISSGDFKLSLDFKANDEIAVLADSFNEMAKGLEERDKVKETFNKFHNKEIADQLLSGEIKMGGDRIQTTIFFSDIRGFTAISESMEPEDVVIMLNEYMTRMVSVIRAHGGIVDKYVGDAIMAVWGIPKNKPDDNRNAVMACVKMREELNALNELRISRGQDPIKIGMGLNRGSVIAGNIGSDEKMEYTVIGDAVNTASRVESMTKEYGTDFLISHEVQKDCGDAFLYDEVESAKVKGKTEALRLFKVKGYKNEQGQEVIVETPYSSYGKEKSDKAA